MTKISQLTDIGGALAANDEFIIRDASDASTPNKKVTASGFFAIASTLDITGFNNILAGLPDTGTQVRVVSSGTAVGISGYAQTTISGITVARTTISGYYENASASVSGFLFPVVTQTDIGTDPNQVPINGYLGTLAFQDSVSVSVGGIVANGLSGIGYALGAGLAVTQITSRTTGVTINAPTGAITLVSAAGLITYQTFTVTNSTVAATDVIKVSQKSGTDKYAIWVTAVAAGSFALTFATLAGTTTEQPVFNFAVIKAVSS